MEESDLSVCAGQKTILLKVWRQQFLQNAIQQEFTSSDKLKFSSSLTIIHHNIRGLKDKIDEIICPLTSNNINRYICLSEHYATEQNLLILNLENYYLGSNFSCTKCIGGGSCIYVRCHLQFNTFDISDFGLEKMCEICASRTVLEFAILLQ